MKKILFVCTGNTCRSSMAEGLARAIAAELKLGDFTFKSAGTIAWPGERAADQAIVTLAEMGIELSAHKATLLTPELIEEADLVLTMTDGHRRQVLQVMPEAVAKIHTLGDFGGISGDIPDPFGLPVESYRRCAGTLRSLIHATLCKLRDSQ